VRTTALYESFIVASAVLARIGSDSLGAHQIAFQLFVFLALVLDGILIGAGDTRFLISGMLAALLGVFVPIALLSLALDLGIVGVWVGLVGLIAVRLATCAWRFSSRRWALVGAPPS
jgi:Na+-driven multidrug efflux pump